MAAAKTIPTEEYHLHSLHCYFIYAGMGKYILIITVFSFTLGNKSKPIVYAVDRVRDGRSFYTRFVKAIQGGKTIFTAQLSFHKLEPDSICHQTPMPVVPPPEECEDASVFAER